LPGVERPEVRRAQHYHFGAAPRQQVLHSATIHLDQRHPPSPRRRERIATIPPTARTPAAWCWARRWESLAARPAGGAPPRGPLAQPAAGAHSPPLAPRADL